MAEWYDQLLELQLRRNRDLWAGLQERVGDGDELRLGFIYLAPGAEEAQSLVEFLRAQTDYDADVRSRQDGDGDGDAAETSWFVMGTTQPAPLTIDLLDEWVEWMIAAGAAEGPAAFDGWAAQLLSA